MTNPVQEPLSIAELVQHPLWSAAADALLLVDSKGKICSINASCQRLLGYPEGALDGQMVEVLVPDEFTAAHVAHREGYQRETAGRSMGDSRLVAARHADGSTVPVAVSLSRVTMAQGPCIVVAIRDLTKRLAAEQRVAALEQERLLVEANDRIARELHDSAMQKLYDLGITSAPPHSTLVDGGVRNRLTSPFAWMRRARPGAASEEPAAIDRRQEVLQLVTEMEADLGFRPRVSVAGPLDTALSPQLASAAFFVLREALANVARHAHATAADVSVDATTDSLRLTVTDNGIGMGALTRRSGLKAMHKRAKALNGSFHIDSSRHGTIVIWAAPIG